MQQATGNTTRGLRGWWCFRRPGVLYFCAIVREFRWTLAGLAFLIFIGGILNAITPADAGGRRLNLLTCFYGAWMAMLAQPVSTPTTWYTTLMDAVYPVFGALLVGEGVVRFALLMVSRRHGEKEWMKVMASTYSDHIVLCGLGHLGYRVLEQLVAGKVPVVGIEKDEDGRFVAAAKALGVPVLIRDMKDDQALLDAGIERARAVVIATNDDMANVEVALDSRRMNPGIRIIMRLFDQQIAAKIAGALTIDAAFSASALAAPVVAALSLDTEVSSSLLIDHVLYVTAEIVVEAGSALEGRSVADAESAHAARILARTPADAVAVSPPAMDAVISAGDKLLVYLAAPRLAALSAAARRIAQKQEQLVGSK
jgi:Trk K+ transport system NAD-binding subunit